MFKILIIDDEKDILELFCRVLKDYEVKTAQNEKEALDQIDSIKFDLIFLDLVIPHINSAELFDHIKKAAPQSKIMLISGFDLGEVVNDLLKSGAVGVMRKPFSHIDEIKQAAEKVLG